MSAFSERDPRTSTASSTGLADLSKDNTPPSNDSSKKKSFGRWTKEEHNRFIEGIKKFGKNWKKVEEYVETRTGAQVRSHAQKFFSRLQKELSKSGSPSETNNNGEQSPESKNSKEKDSDSLLGKRKRSDSVMSAPFFAKLNPPKFDGSVDDSLLRNEPPLFKSPRKGSLHSSLDTITRESRERMENMYRRTLNSNIPMKFNKQGEPTPTERFNLPSVLSAEFSFNQSNDRFRFIQEWIGKSVNSFKIGTQAGNLDYGQHFKENTSTYFPVNNRYDVFARSTNNVRLADLVDNTSESRRKNSLNLPSGSSDFRDSPNSNGDELRPPRKSSFKIYKEQNGTQDKLIRLRRGSMNEESPPMSQSNGYNGNALLSEDKKSAINLNGAIDSTSTNASLQ